MVVLFLSFRHAPNYFLHSELMLVFVRTILLYIVAFDTTSLDSNHLNHALR